MAGINKIETISTPELRCIGTDDHSGGSKANKDEICPDGYEFDSELEICSERNRCSSHPCGENGSCVNENATYRCNCNPGFQFDGYTCYDIDECNEQVIRDLEAVGRTSKLT